MEGTTVMSTKETWNFSYSDLKMKRRKLSDFSPNEVTTSNSYSFEEPGMLMKEAIAVIKSYKPADSGCSDMDSVTNISVASDMSSVNYELQNDSDSGISTSPSQRLSPHIEQDSQVQKKHSISAPVCEKEIGKNESYDGQDRYQTNGKGNQNLPQTSLCDDSQMTQTSCYSGHQAVSTTQQEIQMPCFIQGKMHMIPMVATLPKQSRGSGPASVIFPVLNWDYKMDESDAESLRKGFPPSMGLPSGVNPLPESTKVSFSANFGNVCHPSQTMNPGTLPGINPMKALWNARGSQSESKPLERKAQDSKDGERPMYCEICDDRATGLHYGTITCEGCKGFFKRTVQNKRVYTCLSSGNCEITRTQRNRCQYCRFKKCLQKGMVIAAVREDRMPGGRNSGAVYNMYKMKYKKHKKKEVQPKPRVKAQPYRYLGDTTQSQRSLVQPNNSVLKQNRKDRLQKWLTQMQTSLATKDSVKVENHQNLMVGMQDNCISLGMMGGQHQFVHPEMRPPRYHQNELIQHLLKCEQMQEIAMYNFDITNEENATKVLCKLGDDIVRQLVEWLRQLPFYNDIPLSVHTQMLTTKWHEVLLLTTSVHQATLNKGDYYQRPHTFEEDLDLNMKKLHHYLTMSLKQEISLQDLYREVGDMMEKVTHVVHWFKQLKLSKEEYVCLKVILLLSQAETVLNPVVEQMCNKYTEALQGFLKEMYPRQPNRFQEILFQLPKIQSAAACLLKSRMIYVPFVLNGMTTSDKPHQ